MLKLGNTLLPLALVLSLLGGCHLPEKVGALAADSIPITVGATAEVAEGATASVGLLSTPTNTESTAGRDLTQTRTIGGGSDSVSLWLAIVALGLIPLSYPLQRRFRRWRENAPPTLGWSISYSASGSDALSPPALLLPRGGSDKPSQSPVGMPSSPSNN